jgi:hypothetical protein
MSTATDMLFINKFNPSILSIKRFQTISLWKTLKKDELFVKMINENKDNNLGFIVANIDKFNCGQLLFNVNLVHVKCNNEIVRSLFVFIETTEQKFELVVDIFHGNNVVDFYHGLFYSKLISQYGSSTIKLILEQQQTNPKFLNLMNSHKQDNNFVVLYDYIYNFQNILNSNADFICWKIVNMFANLLSKQEISLNDYTYFINKINNLFSEISATHMTDFINSAKQEMLNDFKTELNNFLIMIDPRNQTNIKH